MKKTLTIIFCLISFIGFTQLNLTGYHLGNNLVTGQQYNASFFPKNTFYISFPGMSEVNFDLNAPFTYSELFEVTGDSVKIKLADYLNDEENDYLSLRASIPVLGFGFRLNEVSNIGVFSNVKNSFSLGMPKDIARWVYNGNGEYLGQEYIVDDLNVDVLSYLEVGIQYTRDLSIAGRAFTGGVRLKYLQGIASATIDNNAQISILTDPTSYRTTFTFQDAALRLGNVDVYDDDGIDEGINEAQELGGTGFGFDIGGQWAFNDKISFNLAINDIGSISWEEASYEVQLGDRSFVLEGVDINADDFSQEFEDNIEEAYESDTVTTSFSTSLTPSFYMGATYKVGKNGFASATWGYTVDLGELRNSIGIGYTHNFGRILYVNSTVASVPQQGLGVGVGMGLRLGALNIHVVGDGLLNNLNLPEAQRVNASIGINFAFGNPDKVKEPKDDSI